MSAGRKFSPDQESLLVLSLLGKAAISEIGILRRGKTGPFRGLWKHPVLPTRLAIVFSGGHAEVIGRMELDSVHSGQLDLRTVGFCL
jgi:hypothetical protein